MSAPTDPSTDPVAAPVAASDAPAAATGAPAAADDGQGDALDKGVGMLAGKLGLGAKATHSNIEKASDGIRSLFKKATGKDVPVADKEYK